MTQEKTREMLALELIGQSGLAGRYLVEAALEEAERLLRASEARHL